MQSHVNVFVFCRAGQSVPPVQVHSLAPVKIQQLLDKDIIGTGAVQRRQSLLREEVGIVGRIDGLSHAENAMGDWLPPTKLGGILDVVNPAGLL